MYHSHHAMIIIAFILTTGVVGIAQLSAVQGAGPTPTTNGYITRLSIPATGHSDTDLHIHVQAFYSVDGRYVEEDIHIEILVAEESAELQASHQLGDVVKKLNISISDDHIHSVNLGRLPQGTYRVRAIYHTAQGGDMIKEDSVAIRHPPVPYTLALCDGQAVEFRSEAHNETFTITIIEQYDPENIQKTTRYNVTNLSYQVKHPPQVLSVYVMDRYGNSNGLNFGHAYVWTYSHSPVFYFWRPIVSVTLVLLGIVTYIILRRFRGGA